MKLAIGEGAANYASAVLMDTTVMTTKPVSPITDHVIDELNSAHDIIHDMFFAITKPIIGMMNPLKEN